MSRAVQQRIESLRELADLVGRLGHRQTSAEGSGSQCVDGATERLGGSQRPPREQVAAKQ